MISGEIPSLELFQALLQQSTDLVSVLNADGILQYASPAYALTLGYEATDVIGTSAFSRIHPGDLDRVRAAFGATRSSPGIPIKLEFRYRHADGAWRTLQTTATNQLDNPVVHGIVINARDITERVHAEEQYRNVFDATSDGLFITALDGIVVDANPAACDMHGYTRSQMIGRPLSQVMDPSYQSSTAAGIESVRQGRIFRADGVHLRKDGSPLHVETHSSPMTFRGQPHMLSAVRDVSDRVQAYDLLEHRVEERTRELSTLLNVSRNVASTLERAAVPNLILDELKMVMDYSGAGIGVLAGGALQIIGYRGPAQSPDLSRTYQPGSWPAWEVLRRREAVLIDDVRSVSPAAVAYREAVGDGLETTHGHVRCFLAVPMVLRDEVIGALSVVHSRPGYYTEQHVVLARAVADHAAVAIENAELYERAQELAVLEERQRLARELHDSVSQALYGIALGTHTARSVLRQDLDRTEEALSYVLAQAEAGLAEMRALIFDLRPEALERDGIVTALCRQAAAVSARQAIAVDTLLGREPDLPFPVKEALYRIAQEALHNIIKHARARNVVISLRGENRRVVLEVRDDGTGFEPDMSFPGHIGLRTMRERAVRAGGSLTIESCPGAGTCIRVDVPDQVEAVA